MAILSNVVSGTVLFVVKFMTERHPNSRTTAARALAALLAGSLLLGAGGCGGCVQSVVENSTCYMGMHYRIDMDPADAEASLERFLGIQIPTLDRESELSIRWRGAALWWTFSSFDGERYCYVQTSEDVALMQEFMLRWANSIAERSDSGELPGFGENAAERLRVFVDHRERPDPVYEAALAGATQAPEDTLARLGRGPGGL